MENPGEQLVSFRRKQAMRKGIRGFSAGVLVTMLLFVIASAAVVWVYTGVIAQERWPIRWLEIDGPFGSMLLRRFGRGRDGGCQNCEGGATD